MNRCSTTTCLRARIPNGAYCADCTSRLQTGAFGKPEWVRRAMAARLPVRVAYR